MYVALRSCVGQGLLELEIVRVETDESIYQWQQWCTFPGISLVVNLEVKVDACSFPALGAYDLVLRFDGRLITYRRFEIFHAKGGS